MPASDPRATEQKKSPGIFISYRRSDSPDAVGRIYDRLVSEFGKARVFKDVDSIPLGQDFRSHLNDIVGGCAAVLAIIGPKWTDTRNAGGTRRLEDPDDFVRIELEAALARDIPVVPVLVGHAPIPGSKELPGTLASMAYRQSIEVRPDPDFHHDATRLVSALKAIIDPHGSQQSPGDVSGTAAIPAISNAPPKHWRRFVWVIALAGLLVPLVATFGASVFKQLREPQPPEMHTDIVTPVTDDPNSFALSPDGKQIAFVAKSDDVPRLWLRSLVNGTAQPLPGSDNATAPFWSPDSRSIAFFASGSLKRLDLDGSQPQILAPAARGSIAGSWSSKGVILFAVGLAEPLSRVAATGGPVTALEKMGGNSVGNAVPVFLPDGQHFLFIVYGTNFGHYLGSLDGAKPVRLATDASQLAYLPSGWLLQVRLDGRLVAQRLDLEKSALVGEPVTVASGIATVSVSGTGLIACRANATGQQQLTWVDRSGAVLGPAGAPDGLLGDPRASPVGQQVALVRGGKGFSDIWLQDGARESRLTFRADGGAAFPVWSPDGSALAFASVTDLAGTFYRKPVNGAQTQELLQKFDKVSVPTSWSADGRYLLYFTLDPGPDLRVLPLTGDRKPFAFLQTPSSESYGQFSPDGRWVAYESNQSGRTEVYVRQFLVPGGTVDPASQAGQKLVSTAGGVRPLWRADGKELYYIDPAGMVVAVPIAINGLTVVPGRPAPLFQANMLGGGTDDPLAGRQYDVARDGRFLINRILNSATVPITLIQNWNPLAKK